MTNQAYTLMQTETVGTETFVFFVRYEDKNVAKTNQKKFGGTLICHSADIVFEND
jgi:hypothetical protein